MKNVFSLLLISIVLAVSLMSPGLVLGGEIATSGHGTASVYPDNAVVSFSIITRDRESEKVTHENAEKYERVISGLKKAGFDKEQVVSSSFMVNTEYDYKTSPGRPVVSGYVANHRIRVKTGDLARLGKLIDAAMEGGATEMNGIKYDSSRIDEIRREAISIAVRNAIADAVAMAAAAGGKLGELINLGTPEANRIPVMENMRYKAMADGPATNIAPDELTVSVTVTGKWVFIRNSE
ncbi:MAG: SIMPL domain-containing protein [Bacteroidales bacterium]|nr:SIMPL domain-containing protein [Candidatus Latescibacterota bacterium]